MTEEITGAPDAAENPFEAVQPLGDVPLSPAVAVGAVALNLAMKYADITTVQDGALYQQYKLEGKNLQGMHLDLVFDYARRIEQHLMTTSNRLSETIYSTLIEAIASEPDEGGEDGAETSDTPS